MRYTPELRKELNIAELIYLHLPERNKATDFIEEFCRKTTEITLAEFGTAYFLRMDKIRIDEDGNIYELCSDGVRWAKNERFMPTELFDYFRACITAQFITFQRDDKGNDYAVLQENKSSLEDWTAMHKMLSKFENAKSMKNLMNIIVSGYPRTEMDSVRCIYFKNGIAWNGKEFITDKKTLRKMHITKMCPQAIHPDAEVDKTSESYQKIAKLLYELADRNKQNLEDINNLLGYIFGLNNRQKKFFILWGHSTNNGKTTLCRLLHNALGDDYSTKLTSHAFAQPSRPSTQVFSDIGEAAGKVFCYSAEPDKGMIFNAGLIKDLTGGDAVKVNQKFKNTPKNVSADFIPVMECNNIPSCRDDTLFTSGRMVVIDFEHTFVGNGEDPLKDFTEEDYANIITVGIQMVQARAGKRLFEWHNKSIDQYIKANNNVFAFLERECVIEDGAVALSKILFNKYVEYCINEKEFQLGKHEFFEELRKLGFSDTREDNKRAFSGIRLTAS